MNSIDQKLHKKFYIRLNLNESSRFGVDLNSITKDLILCSKGIHFHNQNWGEGAFDKIREIIKHFEDNFELKEGFHFNIGGGYNHISQTELLSELNKLSNEKQQYIFFIEPGRMFIKNNGYLVGKVLEVQNIEGKSTGKKIDLNKEIFSVEPNDHAIYLDVKWYLASKRQGTHKAKERADISGSTRKIKKQKGTGGARAGSIKSGTRVGGGRIFGPRPRNYHFKLNVKLKNYLKRKLK